MAGFDDIKFEQIKKQARNISLPIFQKYGKIYFHKRPDELVRNGNQLTWFNALEFDSLYNKLPKEKPVPAITQPSGPTFGNKILQNRGKK